MATAMFNDTSTPLSLLTTRRSGKPRDLVAPGPSPEQLEQNFRAVLEELQRAKPASAKGKYLKSVTVSSTMGPGVIVDVATIG